MPTHLLNRYARNLGAALTTKNPIIGVLTLKIIAMVLWLGWQRCIVIVLLRWTNSSFRFTAWLME